MKAFAARSLAGFAVSAVVLLGACNPFATKGTVPPPRPGGGVVDPQGFPDYIAAWNRDGTAIAGYVPKSCLFPTTATGPGVAESCPVFADDLITLVGHMVPDRGFVPLGVDPVDVPPFPVQAGPSAGPLRIPGATSWADATHRLDPRTIAERGA